MSKTLKEIAEEALVKVGLHHDYPATLAVMLAMIEYAKSICPAEKNGDQPAPGMNNGWNFCRSQILLSIQESEKELNQ